VPNLFHVKHMLGPRFELGRGVPRGILRSLGTRLYATVIDVDPRQDPLETRRNRPDSTSNGTALPRWTPTFLLLALACSSPLEPQSPTAAMGINMAMVCGQQHGLPLKHPPGSLRFYLSPDLQTADWVEGRQIWIRTELSGEVRVYAHAALHAIFNLPGGPTTPHPAIFEECSLWPI
jgi:hypothetical protein